MDPDGLGTLEKTLVEENNITPVRTLGKKFRINSFYRDTAAWGVKTYRTKKDDPFWRFTGLTAMSLYIGNLLSGEQKKFARKMKLEDSTFSQYNTTSIYALFAIPQIGALIASQFSDTHVDDVAFMLNLGVGGAIDAVRGYLAFKKNKPTPAISAFSVGVNAMHYTGKGIFYLTKKAKKKLK